MFVGGIEVFDRIVLLGILVYIPGCVLTTIRESGNGNATDRQFFLNDQHGFSKVIANSPLSGC